MSPARARASTPRVTFGEENYSHSGGFGAVRCVVLCRVMRSGALGEVNWVAFHGEYVTKLAYYELDELQGVVKLDVFQSESVPEQLNFVFVGPRFSCILSSFCKTCKMGGKVF